MSNNVAISVKNLSKCYEIYSTPGNRLKQFILPRLRKLLGKKTVSYYREFWALKDISFEVRRGETIGIIGSNGSGKSTLLQMICGTLTPTTGTVQTHGRVAALLELGAGFNPEFTGRENVYLNATVLGLSIEEIDAKFDAIAAFADIGEFIDQPIKTYSSGMSVRLAFAVQSQIDPDIFIVDEALSVGDAKFQAKCFDRLRQLKENGTCILLVTHSSEQIVSHCTQAILLSKGVQLEAGKPKDVVNRYLDLLFGKEKAAIATMEAADTDVEKIIELTSKPDDYQLSVTNDSFSSRPGYNSHEYRWGDGTASILDYFLYTATASQRCQGTAPPATTGSAQSTLPFAFLDHHPFAPFWTNSSGGSCDFATPALVPPLGQAAASRHGTLPIPSQLAHVRTRQPGSALNP